MGLILIPQPSIIGRGLAFPFRFENGVRPKLASEEELVKMSIRQILGTRPGERPFLVKQGVPFGTNFSDAMFANEDAAVDVLTVEIPRALRIWEPRITVDTVNTSVIADSRGGVIILSDVGYRLRSTNRPDNVVVPYKRAA